MNNITITYWETEFSLISMDKKKKTGNEYSFVLKYSFSKCITNVESMHFKYLHWHRIRVPYRGTIAALFSIEFIRKHLSRPIAGDKEKKKRHAAIDTLTLKHIQKSPE